MFSVEKQQLCGVCCQIMLLFLALQQLTFSYLKVLQNLAESPFPLFFWPHCSRFVDMPFLSFLLLFLFIFSKLDRLLLRIRAVRLLLAHSWVCSCRLCICTCHGILLLHRSSWSLSLLWTLGPWLALLWALWSWTLRSGPL